MPHKLTVGLAWFFIVVGIACMAIGPFRIADGEVMRGFADIIIGGFVALHGYGQWQEHR